MVFVQYNQYPEGFRLWRGDTGETLFSTNHVGERKIVPMSGEGFQAIYEEAQGGIRTGHLGELILNEYFEQVRMKQISPMTERQLIEILHQKLKT